MITKIPGAPTMSSRGSRSVALGQTGLIATSQPLASAAGLEAFRKGGNAIDAAVTAAAVLSVVEPTMTGIGGDLFAIVHDGSTGRTRGLNASGRSPHAASLDQLSKLGHMSIPDHGTLSVTVPGAVDGWSLLLAEYGTLPLSEALSPAIAYARQGFSVAEVVARQWHEAAPLLAADPLTAETFLPEGRPPEPGEIFTCPALAATLELIAAEGRDALYRGHIGSAIARDAERRGGWLALEDFRDHRSKWVEPIRATFADVELLELPPNTQGFVALEALNILSEDDLGRLGHNSTDYLHLLLEALAIAFADRDAHLADPASMPEATLQQLISPDYARSRRREILADRVNPHTPDLIETGNEAGASPISSQHSTGDTVCLAAADNRGNLISLIQSLYDGFGANIVAGDTGIVLHNRGSLFVTNPEHPNHLAPHKLPLHTLVPAMAFWSGRPWLAYGVMGGDMQPQGHLQVLLNLACFGMNIQEAGEAPRARYQTNGVALENGISTTTGRELMCRGHHLVGDLGFGGFQGVLVDPDTGVLMGGSDPRKDGLAIGL